MSRTLSGLWETPKTPLFVLMLLLLALSCHRKPVKVVVGKEGYTHVISKGETLESIAEHYYGDASLGKALGQYNGMDPLKPLEPGTTLLVPFDRKELENIKASQDASIVYNRGTVLARTGQYEQALNYLEQAVEMDPTLVDAWYNLALVYHHLERPEKALPILRNLCQNYPREKTFHYSLGATWRQMDQNEEALKEFKLALEIDPQYREAQYALALTLEALGKGRKAIKAWERYLEMDADSVWADEARMHLERLRRR